VNATVFAVRSGTHQFRPAARFRFLPITNATTSGDGAIKLRVEEGKSYKLRGVPV